MANNEFGSYAADLTNETAGRVADVASRVQDKASELGEKAANAVDARRGGAANTLDSAARGLHQTAEKLPGGPAVTQFAHKAADKIGATADYVRDHGMKDMLVDMESYVKSHPTQALIGAAVVGFLAGRAMRRD